MDQNTNSNDRPNKLAFYDKGPGPAGYTLPGLVGREDHAPTHRINPAYSMGLKLRSSFLTSNIGPGAGNYLIEKGWKANGKDLGYQYTLRIKPPLIDKKVVPAPNVYEVPPPDKYKRRAPTFPFGNRTPIYNKKIAPAPNTYQLPTTLGPRIPDKLAAAEVTLKGDRRSKIPNLSPGPVYDVGSPQVIKSRAPAFSMRIKWADLSGQKWAAGPASYEGKLCSCKVPPGCHLGTRYNDFTGVFRTQCDKSTYDPLIS